MINMPRVQPEYFPLIGGLDQVSSATAISPGSIIDSQNYEPAVNGGYTRIYGHERFNGRAAPSAAVYYKMAVSLTGALAAGDTITGVTSAATGVVIAVPSGYAIFTKASGTFVAAETINVSGSPVGTVTSAANYLGESDMATHVSYMNLAADKYRADITTVTGSGDILGVWLYNGTVYAFRNNAGGTAAVMYKSTASGWSAITFGEEVSFSDANTSVGDGDTLTQGGVTATIARVVVQTGTLASGVNTGRLIITGRSGGNYAAGAATSTGGGSLTLSGAQTAITLLPGGRFEFVNYNFGGATGTYKMYGCDGVNRAFEFDGTTFVPITTGMTTDKPKFITAHRNHLFLSFGSSAQHSGISTPYMWSIVSGAAELAMGDTISGMLPLAGSETNGAMAMFTRNTSSILYGTSSSDWALVPLSSEAGAVAYTAQVIGTAIMLDDRGIRDLSATQSFGNYEYGTLSKPIQNKIDSLRGHAVASCVVRSKNQYRLFFDDGTVIVYGGRRGKSSLGFTTLNYGKEVTCICSSEDTDGTERIFFGSTDGYVYEDIKGTSFDGSAIEYWARIAFNHSKSPTLRKNYKLAFFDVDVEEYASVSVSYELAFGDISIQPTSSVSSELIGNGGYWDQFYWENFTWDAAYISNPRIKLQGTAKNISLLFYGNSEVEKPHTLQGVQLHYITRRMER